MYLRKLLPAIWLIPALLACTRSNESTPKPKEMWMRGDTAVVEPTAADFFESQVLDVGAGKLRVQSVQGGESMLVGMADAYAVPKSSPTLAPNSWAICQTVPHRWFACRVIDKSGTDRDGHDAGATKPQTIVVDAYGKEHAISSDQGIIAPTSLSAMNIARRFDQLSKRVNFERSFREAGEPRRQAGWQPAPRRLVLARRQGQWFGAQVTEVDEDRIVVRWDGEKGTTDLAQEDVAPQPPACGMPGRGDRALLRPAGHGAAWIPVAVVSIEGSDVSVEDIERNRSTHQARDLCPLGNATGATAPR